MNTVFKLVNILNKTGWYLNSVIKLNSITKKVHFFRIQKCILFYSLIDFKMGLIIWTIKCIISSWSFILLGPSLMFEEVGLELKQGFSTYW